MTAIALTGQQSRAQEVYAYLRDAILSGKIRPNERLVEDQIADLAGVSRTPVREAIRKLEVDGLVRQTRLGIVVVELTVAELREFCQVREVLEGTACRLAAESRSELELAALERLGEEYEAAVRNGNDAEIIRINRLFHERIWDMANNRYLATEVSLLRARIDGISPTSPARSKARHAVAIAEHREMLDALRRHDADRAESVAREHFRRAMARRLGEVAAAKGPGRVPST